MNDVLIIGAGLAGLAAAEHLSKTGARIAVIDKGRSVGGRLATRRINGARLDHGAQFFTVRGDEFARTIDAAIAEGVVDIWCRGFGGEDGHPRYFCPGGMTALAKWLAARCAQNGVQIDLSTRATAIRAVDHFETVTEEGGSHHGSHMIVTSPVPQTLALLDAGDLQLPTALRHLRDLHYDPTLALLVTLEGESAVPQPGGVQQHRSAPFTFIADNHMKGISETSALTLHVNPEISGARWDDDPQIVTADLLELAAPWIGDATVVHAQLKKWRYATPITPLPDRTSVVRTVPGNLLLAGDAFGGPKVEGAFNSGRAAGETIANALAG